MGDNARFRFLLWKIRFVQKATVDLLNAIYEQDFLECSYGFRPGRSAQDALDEVGRVICTRPISTVLEADITGYFDAIVRDLLVEMIEKRVSDGSILRLIGKWINVGVIEDGRLLVTETGTGQGQVISPLLANIYLHYVLDEWFETEVKPRLKGEAYEIRYADDFILCFQYREDAERVLDVLTKRFAKYGLKLHPDKTRLMAFGRQALAKSEEPGGRKPATFDFLGFTHICKRSRKGKFTIHVRTMRKRLRRSLKKVTAWCKEHRHDPVEEQQKALNRKLQGHYQYYGRPTNYRSLWEFYRSIRRIWKYWLNRRTRGHTLNWDEFAHLLLRYPLLRPRITRSWASAPAGEFSLRNRVREICTLGSVRGEVADRLWIILFGHAAGNGGYRQGFLRPVRITRTLPVTSGAGALEPNRKNGLRRQTGEFARVFS